ncbi:hypothetical protein KKG46_00060 [Patescibacteria group bacterium]|nr:hypothetical protein [Patescibacteria group bacterium]
MKNEYIKKILEYDKKTDNYYQPEIERIVSESYESNKPIELLMFTCSTINDGKLYSDKPWEYVSLDTSGNNLEKDISRLRQILEQINKLSKVKLTIIIGNTDPYYIYLQQFQKFDDNEKPEIWKNFITRWATYRDSLEKWLKNELPQIDVEVMSWYSMEKMLENDWATVFENEFIATYQNIEAYFSEEDILWEHESLSAQFGPGKYFVDLDKPNQEVLKDWVKRKFAEYAVQGLWLKRKYPDAILIQNEKPSDLRTKMYQPILKERSKQDLPIIYFFGVDNVGYA